MSSRIEKVLDEKVRPYMMTHEGSVEVVDFEEGVLKVRLMGQCAGCPSAQITTEELIEKTVTENVPEVKKVLLVREVHSDILDFARKLLTR